MPTIKTTTKDFLDGVAVKDDQPTIEWESTGYLHVRLMDEFGQAPLAAYLVSVQVPGQGTVELTTDKDGVVFHEHVPFQDYELALEAAKVHAPAVATRDERHERHVPGVQLGFVNLYIGDDSFAPVAEARFTLSGPASVTLFTDEAGMASHPAPLPTGEYELRGEAGHATVTLGPRRDGVALVALSPTEAS